MRHKASEADKLLLLTLTLEAALAAEDWSEANQLFGIRAAMIEQIGPVSEKLVQEIGVVEERMLTTLRQRLVGVRSDLRNLTAALRIASSYTKAERPSSLSLAG